MFRVVVGVSLDELESEVCVVVQEVDEPGAAGDQCLGQLGQDHPVGQARQVGQAFLERVVDTLLGRDRIARDPDSRAGQRGRAADQLGLLEDRNVSALQRGGKRGSEAGSSRPENDHVVHLLHRYSTHHLCAALCVYIEQLVSIDALSLW